MTRLCCNTACRLLEDAVRWCSAVQKELLVMSWPEALLQWGDCRDQRDPATGAIIWRGLRVRMGMAFGRPSYKKPLNTGEQQSISACSMNVLKCILTSNSGVQQLVCGCRI